MANYCSNWASRRGCRAILTVALVVGALPASGAQTEAALTPKQEIRYALTAFQNLRSDLRLGRSAIEEAAAVGAGPHHAPPRTPSIIPGTGQSLLVALCRVLTPEDRGGGATCLNGINDVSELGKRLLYGRIALQAAANQAIELHQEAYSELVLEHFDKVVCRGTPNICGQDPNDVKEWWKENGVKAFMLLDRIGREYIKLTEREADKAIANAREYVHARLKAAMARPEVKIAVTILNTTENGSRFHALRDVEKDPVAALEAVTAVSVWVQESISKRIREKIDSLPESAKGLRHLKAALQDREGTALDQLTGGFSESRQRMVEIIALGKGLSSRLDKFRQEVSTETTTRKACQLPDPAAMMQGPNPKVSPTGGNLRKALDGIAEFIRLCAGGESGSVGAKLRAALAKVVPPPPSRVEILLALCRFGDRKFPGNAEVLRKAFTRNLPDPVAGIASGSETDLCRRIRELPARAEVTEAPLEGTEDSAGEKKDQQASTKVRDVLTDAKDLLQILSTELDSMAGEFWAVRHLMNDRALVSLPTINSRGCDADAQFGLTWQLSQPRLGADEQGLTVTYSGHLALCRTPPGTAGGAGAIRFGPRMHRLAEVEGEVRIPLSDLFGQGAPDVSAAVNDLRWRIRNEAHNSLTIDEAAFRPETLGNAFEEALSVGIPPELRKRFKFDELGYEPTRDKWGLVIRVPITVPHYSKEFCVVIHLRDGSQGGPEGCRTLDRLNAGLWAELRTELIEAVLETIQSKVETELQPFLGETLAGKIAAAGVEATGISFRLGGQQAVLEVDVAQALRAFAGTNLLTVKGTDIKGSLVVALDLDNGDLSVTSTPVLDLNAIATRLYKEVAEKTQETAGLIAFTPLPRNAQACNAGFGLAMTLGSRLPLEGRIGYLCWRNGQFTYEAPAEKELHITLTAAGIRLVVGVGDANATHDEDEAPRELSLEAGLQAMGADDPWGLRDADVAIVVVLNLENGSVTIPADAEGNQRLYAHIRGRAQSFLPSGATISRLELSTQGIEIKFSGLEDAAFSIVFDRFFDADYLEESKATFAKLFPRRDMAAEACWAARAAAVGGMLKSFKAPDSTDQEVLEQTCNGKHGRIALRSPRRSEDRDEGTNTLALLPVQGEQTGTNIGLRWTCRARSKDELRSCDIEFPELNAFCDGLRVRATREGKFTVRGAEECLQKTLGSLVPASLRGYEAVLPELKLECPDPRKPSACGVTATSTLSFEHIGEAIEKSAGSKCEFKPGNVKLPVLLSFDGQLRLRNDRLGAELRAKAGKLAEYTKCVLIEKMDGSEGTDKNIAETLPWLGKLKTAYTEVQKKWPSEFKCRVVLAKPVDAKDKIDCSTYAEGFDKPASKTLDLLLEPPKALVFSRSVQLFDTTIDIEATIGIQGDGGLFEPALGVSCPGCADRMDELAAELAGMIAKAAGDTVNYERGATLTVVDTTLRFSAPLSFEFEPLGIEAPFEAECSLGVLNGEGFDCGVGQPDVKEIIAGAVSELISQRLDKGFNIPLGPLTGTIEKAETDETDPTKITLVGTMAIAGMDPPVDVKVALPLFGHRFQVHFDGKVLEERLGKVLADQLTEILGTVLPITINKVTVSRSGSSGVPEGVKISSNADIAGVFKISVPDVVLGRQGLEVDGPSELAIEFPDGVPFPAPPVTFCPTGGTVGSDRIAIFATVTVAECTAEAFLSIKGRAEVALANLLNIQIHGDMVLLKFLNLGHAMAELDLAKLLLRSEIEIGGPIADVLYFQSTMEVIGSGDNPHAETTGELRLFRVPVGQQSVYLDFKHGGLKAQLKVDLFGVITADGRFGMERFAHNPYLDVKGSAQVLGLQLAGLGLTARPNYARAGFRVLGIGLTVVVPGLETFSQEILVKLIKRLLTPDLKNLDEAIFALLQGRIEINPLADFGPGGGNPMDGEGRDDPPERDGAEGEKTAPEPAPDDTPQEQKVPPAKSNAAQPSKLNPPGRLHVSFEKSGENGYRIDLMEGARRDTTIAKVPEHRLTLPIFKDDAGMPLAFSRNAYAHLGDGIITAGPEGCPEDNVIPTVFTFTGVDEPQVGFFELCRMRSENDEPMSTESISMVAESSVMAKLMGRFLTGLSAFPAAMPELIEPGNIEQDAGGPVRVLQHGWAGRIDDREVIAGLVSPGRLLVVADLPGAAEDDECTVTPSKYTASSVRAFVFDAPGINGVLDKKALQPILRAFPGLAACSSGHVGLIGKSKDELYLAAHGNVGRWDHEAKKWVLLRKADPEERVKAPDDPMIRFITRSVRSTEPDGPPPPSREKIEELVSAEPKEQGSVAALKPGGSGDPVVFRPDGADCVAQLGVEKPKRITGFGRDIFGGQCVPPRRQALIIGFTPGRDENAHDSGRVLLLEFTSEGPSRTASLVHLGWDKGQKQELGRSWNEDTSFQLFDRALNGLPVDKPLELVAAPGFPRTEDGAASAVGLVFRDGDGVMYLVWASDAGSGTLTLPHGLTIERSADLPRLLRLVSTDDRLVHPARLNKAAPLHENLDRLVLSHGAINPDGSKPVIAWSPGNSESGLPAGWQISARLRAPSLSAAASLASVSEMFDKRLAEAWSEPTFDAWMFRFNTALGISLRNESVEEVRWRSGDTVQVEPRPSKRVADAIEKTLILIRRRNLICSILLYDHRKQRDWLNSTVESGVKQIRQPGLAPDEFIAGLAESLASDHAQAINHCDVAYVGGRDSNFRDFIEGLKRDGFVVSVNRVLDAIGSTRRLGTSRHGPKTDQYTATIAGFHELSTPTIRGMAARTVLAEFEVDTSARSGWRILRRDEDPAKGDILWAKFAEEGISQIHVFRNKAFVPAVEITGEPLPVRLIDEFLDHFNLAEVNVRLRLDGKLVRFDGREPAWAAVDADSLVVFLIAGGQPRTVTIRGVTKDARLAGLVRFAVNSRGAKFEVLDTPQQGQVLKVTDRDGAGVRLVLFDEDLKPEHWVGLADGAHVSDRSDLDALSTLVRAVGQIDSKSYEYDPDRVPPRWAVHADEHTLVVQPLANAPYLLVGRTDGVQAFPFTALCTPPVEGDVMLDLARQGRGFLGQTTAGVDDIERVLEAGCGTFVTGVMHFLPALGDPPTGLLYGIDGMGRLIVAVYRPCPSGSCTLKRAITRDKVPESLAPALVSRLAAALGAVPRASHLTLDEDAERPAGRPLLYTWTRPGEESGDRLLLGLMTGEVPCVTGVVSFAVDRGGPVAFHALETDPIRPAIVRQILRYIPRRLAELGRQGCAGLDQLRLFILVEDDVISIFEEEDVLAPPVRHAGIQGAVKLASLSLPAARRHRSVVGMQAMAAEVIRKRAHLREPDVARAEVSLPPDVSRGDRGGIYRAIRPYMTKTDMASLDFERVGPRDSRLYVASFDEGTKLMVDAEGGPGVIRLRSKAGLPGVQIIRQAMRYGPPHDESRGLPPTVELIEASESWLLVDPGAAVWRLGTSAERLGTLPELDTLARRRVLNRIGRDPVPFCVFNPDDSAWYRKHDDQPCDLQGHESRDWSAWNGTEWTEIHTALLPSTALLAQARAVLPSINPPEGSLSVRVKHFDQHGLILATVSQCRIGAVRLYGLHHAAEESANGNRANRMEWQEPTPVDVSKNTSSTNCVNGRDLDAVLEVFAGHPGSLLKLLDPVASVEGYSTLAIPVAVEKGGKINKSHVGLLGQSATLFAADGGEPGFDWAMAVRAFVAMRLGKSLPQDQPPDLKRLHLVIGPLDRRWLVSDTTHTYTAKVDGQAVSRVSRRPLGIREDALKGDAKRELVSRLLRGLHHRPKEEWPESLLVDGEAPYFAMLEGEASRLALATASEISNVAEVEFLNVPGNLSSGSLVRRVLKAGMEEWNDRREDVASLSFLVQETGNGSQAVLMAADKAEIHMIGYWTDDVPAADGKVLVDVKIATSSPPSRDFARAIADGLVGLASPGTSPSLEGGPGSLRLCSDALTGYRLVRYEGQSGIDVAAYVDGQPTACSEITNDETANDKYGSLIDRLFRAITAKTPRNVTAIVLLSDSDVGLIARANGTAHTLLSPDAEETGCKSTLRGNGARLLAQIVASNPGIRCLEQTESPFGQEPHRAGVAAEHGRLYLAHHEGNGTCRVELGPHGDKPPTGNDGARFLEQFAKRVACFPGKGHWFHVFGTAFAVAGDRIWTPKGPLNVRIKHVVPARQRWLARWLLSPGVQMLFEKLKKQDVTAVGTSAGVRISIDPAGRTHLFLDGRTCGVSRRPSANDRIRVPQDELSLERTADDERYSCGSAVFDLGQVVASKFAHVTMKDTQNMSCFLESPGTDAFKRCVGRIKILHRSNTVLDSVQHDTDKLHELLSDLYKNDDTKDLAGKFLEALDPAWQFKWGDWSPRYRYILRQDHKTDMFRFNIFTPRHCLQIETSVLHKEIGEWWAPMSPKCGSKRGYDLECVLRKFAITVGADDRGPLWFKELFRGDPRYAIEKASEDCTSP